jgi:uncharacterized protein (DUF4415 family)
MRKHCDDPCSRPDEGNLQRRQDDFRRARPALELAAELFGTQAVEILKRGRGRPAKPNPKVNQTLRMDQAVLDAYRNEGSGWQARINEVLRANMPRHDKA